MKSVLLVWFIFLFIYWLVLRTCTAAAWGGPYEIHISDAEECADTGTHEVILPISLRRHYKTKVTFAGEAVLPYGWNNVQTAQVDIAQWFNGKWVEKFVSKNFGGVCSAVKSMAPDLAKQAFVALGTNDCPKPGNYTLKEMSTNLKLTGIPVFVYGKYRCDVSLLKKPNNVKVGCYTKTAEVVPKPGANIRKGNKRNKLFPNY